MREIPVHLYAARMVRRCLAGAAPIRLVALLCFATAPLGARAQMFIRVAPPSAQEESQPSVTAMPNTGEGAQQSRQNSGAASANQEAILSDTGPVKIVDQSGKEAGKEWFTFHGWRPTFYFNTELTYDDNIFIAQHKTGDFVSSFQPGIVLGWGDYRSELPRLGGFQHEFQIPADVLTADRYIYLDYHPTVEIFASNSSQDAVDQYLHAAGSYHFERLLLQGDLLYQTLSNSDIDAGDRVDRSVYSATLSGSYFVDEKTTLEEKGLFFATEFDSSSYQSSIELEETTYLDYQIAPKTNISAGLAIGYLIPEIIADQYFQQALGRVRWTPTDKFYMSAEAGVEFREAGGGTSRVNGVFDITANFTPFNGTQLSFSAARVAFPSESEIGEDLVQTNANLNLQQRILGRLYLNAGVGYGNADYERLSGGPGQDREDNTISGSIGIGSDLTQYAGIQLASTVVKNFSTFTYREFDDELVSLQVNLTY